MKKILFALLLSLLLIPSIAVAADFKDPDVAGNVTVSSGESFRNLYTAGSNVDIRAAVMGDLSVAGGNVGINSNVEKGLIAAGGNINLNGGVGQSARVAGGNIIVNGKITEDIVAVGGTIKLNKEAGIFGDAVVAGGQIEIDGKISGKAKLAGETIIINGEIAGDVVIDGTENLTIGDTAIIGGKLIYKSTREGKISPNAKIAGGVDFQKTEKNYNIYGIKTGIVAFSVLMKLISLFLTLLLIAYFLPRSTKNFVTRALTKPGSALGWGFVSLIIVPIVSIALMFSGIFTSVGFIATFAYIAFMILAMTMSALLIGSLLTKQMNKTKEYLIDWKVAAIGSILTMILSLIPVVGWIILVAFFLIAFGEMVQIIADKFKAQRLK